MKARKKPVIHEVYHWKGDFWDALQWNARVTDNPDTYLYFNIGDASLKVRTLEGDMTANLGDYIICGVKGELWFIKEDIFKETYDLYDEELYES